MTAKLTLGPVLFNWKPETLRDFYFRIADEAPVDTVHVGEVVCSKRTPFFQPFIPEVIERLQAGGKEVVLSSLALIMNDREMAAARDRQLTKDACQYVCADDPDGMAVETLDEVPFLAVNGTQTMSFHYMDLIGDLDALVAKGVKRFRLWPQNVDMVAVAALFRAVLDHRIAVAEAEERLAGLCPGVEFANGYIHGRAGHLFVDADT